MKKRYKRAISIFSTLIIAFIFTISGSALNENTAKCDEHFNADKLAEKYLSIRTQTDEQGGTKKYIRNISQFRAKLLENATLSDAEAAKLIYRYLGKDEDYIDNLPEDKLLEALTFTNCVETINYIKCHEDGTNEYLSEAQTIQELSEISRSPALTPDAKDLLSESKLVQETGLKAVSIDPVVTNTNDGYMRITLTAYATSGSVFGRSYYIADAYALWLKIPFFKLQDVLVIYSDGTYDNTYNNYGYYTENVSVRADGSSVTNYYNINNYIYKNSGANNPDAIWFEYPEKICSVGLRFNMWEYTYSGSTGHQVTYSNMKAYVRFKVSLYHTDGGVQAIYGHKQAGIGSISINPANGSIGLSIVGTMAKYPTETLSIYDYK